MTPTGIVWYPACVVCGSPGPRMVNVCSAECHRDDIARIAAESTKKRHDDETAARWRREAKS